MAGIGDLVNQVISTVATKLGLSGTPGAAYPPEFTRVTNTPKYNQGEWKDNPGYGFRVVRVKDDGSGVPVDGWRPFILQVNPQSLDQDEIFAINVTPTFRGVIVEHQGSVLKDISIQGTTGISPGRTTGGAFSKTGKPVLGMGRSGYEEFNELRSYFRAYVEAKRIDDRVNGELRLVFDNNKDYESLYVEPQKFSMHRAKGFLYNYNIVLKAIGVAHINATAEEPNVLNRLSETLSDVNDLLATANAYINAGVGILNQVERGFTDLILGPIRALTNIVNSLNTAVNTVSNFGSGIKSSVNSAGTLATRKARNLSDFGVTRTSLETLKADVDRVRDNMIESVGIDLTSYNEATGRVTTSPGVTRDATYLEHKTIHGMMLVSKSISLLLAQNKAFVDDVSDEINDVVDKYGGTIAIATPRSAKVSVVMGGDTIQTIAARELGDPDRFRELILLNKLQPPYIDDTSAEGVLIPGDSILIPRFTSALDMGARESKLYPISEALSVQERAFGIDLRLDGKNDIVLTNRGDYDLIGGILNFTQALLIKLSLEPGSLKRHLAIGTGLQPGNKITSRKLGEIRNQVYNSLLADTRTQSVPSVIISVDNSKVEIVVAVKPKSLNQVIPLPITLPN